MEGIDAYVDAASRLPREADEECLRRMVGCVRDVEMGEAQYELVEACERFPIELYVPLLARESLAVEAKAPRWYRLMMQSVMNGTRKSQLLVQVFPSLPAPTQQALLRFVDRIEADDPKYGELRDRLTAAVGPREGGSEA